MNFNLCNPVLLLGEIRRITYVQEHIRLLQNEYGIPNVRIHLRKQIPIGAGLGGGSSDAVTVIKMLIDLFQLKLSVNEMEEISAELGSDCAFFVRGGLQLATGRGELLTKIIVNSIPKYFVLMNLWDSYLNKRSLFER